FSAGSRFSGAFSVSLTLQYSMTSPYVIYSKNSTKLESLVFVPYKAFSILLRVEGLKFRLSNDMNVTSRSRNRIGTPFISHENSVGVIELPIVAWLPAVA